MFTELSNQLVVLFQSNLTSLVFLFDFVLKSLFLVAIAKYYERVTSPFFSNSQKHNLWLTVLLLLGLLPLAALLKNFMLNSMYPVPSLTLVTVLVPSDLAQRSTESAIYLDRLLIPIVGIYVLVFLFHLAKLAISLGQIHRIHSSAEFEAPIEITKLLDSLRLKLGICRPVSLGISELSPSPMTYGTFRPAIILPSASYYDDAVLLENVLLHELGHIKRADHLTYLACYLVAALNWFNPFVWVSLKQLVLESEYACDNEVLKHHNRHTEFAGQLLSIARNGLDKQCKVLAGRSMITRGELSLRIENILQSNESLQGRKMHSSLLPISMLLLLFLLTSTGRIFALENESEYASEDLRLIHSELPIYPTAAFENRVTGFAQFSFSVNSLGRIDPHSIVLKNSNPNQLFVVPSRDALNSFIFAPKKVNGKRVSTSSVNYTFEFDIRI